MNGNFIFEVSLMFSELLVKKYVDRCLEEDGLLQNYNYLLSLPETSVGCELKIKSDLVLAGLPIFFDCFQAYSKKDLELKQFLEHEGKFFTEGQKFQIEFSLPFSLALSLERIALNLLMRTSSIASTTRVFRSKLKNPIAILDTRKTTPGLRAFEKYAVNVGGGNNHRFSQVDSWMIKDNHKSFFGGLKKAIQFFKEQKNFYTPLIVEIHSLKELEEACKLGVRHVMLDNFSVTDIEMAIKNKPNGMTYEISGGVNLENIEQYDIAGIDAISIGMLTYAPLKVDLSLKYKK
jgi:nicotinate-nucleotide pyrophosphorylase (carboxylating)